MSTAAVAVERVGEVIKQIGQSPLWSAAGSAL